MKEQHCLIPGTPTKPERPQTRKGLSGLEEEHKEEEESCIFNGVESSVFSIDLNKPACSWGDDAESSHELVSGGVIEGFKIDNQNPVSSKVPSMDFIIDYGASQAYADTKQLDHSESSSSKLDFVPDDAIMREEWEEIHTKEPSEKVTSKLDSVQDEVMQENCDGIHIKEPDHVNLVPDDLDSDDAIMQENFEEIQVKTRKPKRKRYTPKVVIDDKLAPKPPPKPKKLPKSAAPKEMKPRTRKTPEQKPQIPATPKQTKEKKCLDFQSEHLEAKDKDFESEQFPVKPNIKGPRSKRRRRLHLFNLISHMQEIEIERSWKCKENNKRPRRRKRLNLFDMHGTIRWSGRRKRSPMNRPRPVRPLLAINWRWSGRKMRLPMNRRVLQAPITKKETLDFVMRCKEIAKQFCTRSEEDMDTENEFCTLCKSNTTKPKGRKRVVGKRQIDSIIQKLRSLSIRSDETALVPFNPTRKKQRAIRSDEAALVPFNPTRKKQRAEVLLDSESLRIWNLLMNTGDDDKSEETPSEETQNWFAEERKKFAERVSYFNARMFQIQGDRGFRKWRGSVIDSVVGVFLTQNVSDHFSSTAYMTLASRFPLWNKFQAITWSQESTGSNLTEYDAQGNLYFVTEPEPERKTEVRELTNMLVEAPELRVQEVAQVDENTKLENENGKSPEAMEHKSSKHESPSMDFVKKNSSTSRGKTREAKKSKEGDKKIDWESLRRKYSTSGTRSSDQMDSVDWNAVRLADPNIVADAIKERGQQNMIAERIQEFLNRVVEKHKSLDLEWLRTIPPDLAKKYLLEINGLGLKSVECVRLLCLNNIAFPVDTNVARITVRLGWVPLQPLPEELQIHLLEQYPIMDSIQKYLWPRLCNLDHDTLYELHYQMITFGKVFCTKRNPNCNACPMRTDCKHFASAFASSRLALPGPADKREASPAVPQAPTAIFNPLPLAFPHSTQQPKICEPIIEEPIEIEELPTFEAAQSQEVDEGYDSEGLPIMKLNLENLKENLCSFNGDYSKAVVALNSFAASIPRPKLKNVSRLRTEHLVYQLPRNHRLLHELDQTETKNETQYHLAIWRPGETVDSLDPPKTNCKSKELYGVLCNDQTCFPCNTKREEDGDIVRGTLLIPCRVATGGRFPLNGTYFQTNEVFADYETSQEPLIVPRKWIGDLKTRTAYFGTSIMTSISKGLSEKEIQKCFWNGVVCVRGFERATKAPRPLGNRFHKKITKVTN